MSAEQCRIGVVGNGDAAKSMLESFSRHPEVALIAAADPEVRARARFADRYAGQTFTTMEELIESCELDGIYIAAPTKLHTAFVTRALNAGIHVLVEKPLTPDLASSKELVDLAAARGLALLVNHKRSVDPPILTMWQVIESGMIGRVRAIHRWHYTDWFYRPRGEDERDPFAGGVVLRQGAHEFDVIRMLAGGSRAISMRGEIGDYDPRRKGEGAYYSWINYDDGLVATSIYGGYGHFSSNEFINGPMPEVSSGESLRRLENLAPTAEVEAELKRASVGTRTINSRGTYGYTLVNCELGDMRPTESGTVWIYDDNGRREVTTSAVSGVDSVTAEFIRAIAHACPPLHGGAWGIACLEQCLAVRDSSISRREVQLTRQGSTDRRALESVIGDGSLTWI